MRVNDTDVIVVHETWFFVVVAEARSASGNAISRAAHKAVCRTPSEFTFPPSVAHQQ